MSVKLQGYLDVPAAGGARKLLPAAGFDLQEAYNSGWRGRVVFGVTTTDDNVHAGNMMASLMAAGVVPGASAVLRVILRDDDSEHDGTVVRSWPVVLGLLRPHQLPQASDLACSLRVVDPIGFLADRPVWGAYRACSIAEMIGGALSVAAGGDGRPTLNPAMAHLPQVSITPVYRRSLAWMHYGLAVGQTLGEWLVDVLGRLGLRLEVIGRHDGSVEVRLCDSRAGGAVLPMAVAGAGDVEAENAVDGGNLPGTEGAEADGAGEGLSEAQSGVTNFGPIRITGIHAQAGKPWRASVVDDPDQGGFRRVGRGGVGNYFSGLGIGPDEAARRAVAPVLGSLAEMFAITAASRQAAFRPGRIVVLSHPLRTLVRWQIALVHHSLSGDVYSNTSTLLNAAATWLPERPREQADIVVPGVVDAGRDLSPWEPVPRDRLGRIRVSFPFAPAPTPAQSEVLDASDTNQDGQIRLDDFDDPSRFDDTEAWEARVEEYRSGEYDDPYGNREDLTPEETANRKALAEKRREVLQYMAYRQAKSYDEADHDRDGYVTRRDAAMSDELQQEMADPEKRAELERQWQERESGNEDSGVPEQGSGGSGDGSGDSGEVAEDEESVLEEYGRLFGEGGENDDLATTQARLDAEAAAEKWPARLPLGIAQPMAGGLHGFVTAHRQGDACRVLVHHPFWAEIVGFQYRDDRALNQYIQGATAGIVVEHDMGYSWSGMVFRPTEDVEESGGEDRSESETSPDEGGEEETPPKGSGEDETPPGGSDQGQSGGGPTQENTVETDA